MICARHSCGNVGTVETEMGAMCPEHSKPLLFQIQRPYELRNVVDRMPKYVPWAFMRPHDQQARRNHGGQTLARLAERGGLSVKEALAVVLGREWNREIEIMPREQAVEQFLAILEAWQKSQGSV